jgi:hypothetical protein
MHNKIIYLCFCLFCLINKSQAINENLSINEALELAANQQVLSQKAAKVYLALCNNMMEPKLYQERDATIEKFDEQLHQLSLFTPSDLIKENIQALRALWKEYKAIANWSIKNDAASKLIKLSTGVLQAAKSLHGAYSEYQKSQITREQNSDIITINQYIKQNNNQLILIQRVMLYYLAEKQGIDPTASGHKLDDAQKVFARILNILDDAKISSKAIKVKIQLIKNTWNGISMHLVFVNKDQSYVEDMLNRAATISKSVKEITALYRKLAVKLNISYAINEATAQSMLTQKIAKAYIASANDHLANRYKKEVSEYVVEFENKIESMIVTAHTNDIKDAIKVVKIMWKNYKRLVTDFETMDEVRAIKVLEQCHVVMAACDRVADQVERYAQNIPAYKAFSEKDGKKTDSSLDITRQIFLSSKLRIYSQRVALYFIMTAIDLDSHLSNERLKSCLQDFEAKFKELTHSRLNSVAMTKLLESCSREWDWIVTASKTSKESDIDLMLENSDLLSRKLMKMTNLYEHKMNDLFAEDIMEESPAASNPPSDD